MVPSGASRGQEEARGAWRALRPWQGSQALPRPQGTWPLQTAAMPDNARRPLGLSLRSPLLRRLGCQGTSRALFRGAWSCPTPGSGLFLPTLTHPPGSWVRQPWGPGGLWGLASFLPVAVLHALSRNRVPLLLSLGLVSQLLGFGLPDFGASGLELGQRAGGSACRGRRGATHPRP